VRTEWKRWIPGFVGAAILLTPLTARADLGIPVGAVFWPASWILFLPIVLIEAGVASRVLRLTFRESLTLSMKANAWSTGAGVPLACLLMLFIGIFLGSGPSRVHSSAWLADLFLGSAVWLEGLPDWVTLAGPALICVPCYFLSVRIEAWSAAKTVPKGEALRWAKIANRVTYGFLIAVLVSGAVVTAKRKAGPDPAAAARTSR
jgi:hypothetical protein